MNGLALRSTDRDEMRRQGLISDRASPVAKWTLVTIFEAADICGCPVKTIRSAISRRELPVVRFNCRNLRIEAGDLETWRNGKRSLVPVLLTIQPGTSSR